MTIESLALEEINEKFFGDEKTNRYLINVYRECVDKLIIVNTLIEVWSRTKGAHEHTKGKICNECAIFFQIYDSCADSLFLHLRLLFSREEPLLANALFDSIAILSVEDFVMYYSSKYKHDISEEQSEIMKSFFMLATDNQSKISKLYMKRIEPYQSFAFHQPNDGKYYKVAVTKQKGEGLTYITHTRSIKFRRDLAAAKEMLNLIGEVIHQYLRLSSRYFDVQRIYPENYIMGIISLLGVELSEATIDEMTKDIVRHIGSIIHLLECSDGLSSHNRLLFARISS